MNAFVYTFATAINALSLLAALAVFLLALVALIQIATTRPDAFTVIDRQKQNWLLLTGGAMVAGGLGMLSMNFQILWIIGAVIAGMYWQDVRPSIKDVLGNAGGTW